jgi:hypothetical protein
MRVQLGFLTIQHQVLYSFLKTVPFGISHRLHEPTQSKETIFSERG